jgi:hypothetical protein
VAGADTKSLCRHQARNPARYRAAGTSRQAHKKERSFSLNWIILGMRDAYGWDAVNLAGMSRQVVATILAHRSSVHLGVTEPLRLVRVCSRGEE